MEGASWAYFGHDVLKFLWLEFWEERWIRV